MWWLWLREADGLSDRALASMSRSSDVFRPSCLVQLVLSVTCGSTLKSVRLSRCPVKVLLTTPSWFLRPHPIV